MAFFHAQVFRDLQTCRKLLFFAHKSLILQSSHSNMGGGGGYTQEREFQKFEAEKNYFAM